LAGAQVIALTASPHPHVIKGKASVAIHEIKTAGTIDIGNIINSKVAFCCFGLNPALN
jgi:hypothetical protein